MAAVRSSIVAVADRSRLRPTRTVRSPSSCRSRPAGPPTRWRGSWPTHMKDTLGQSLIIENVTGAGSTIGTSRAIAATPDGYTLIVGNWSSHVGAGALYPVSWHIVQRPRTDRRAQHVCADDRRPHRAAGQRHQGADRLAEGQPRQGHGGERRRGLRRACLRPLLHGEDRHQVPVRAVSRRRAGDERSRSATRST